MAAGSGQQLWLYRNKRQTKQSKTEQKETKWNESNVVLKKVSEIQTEILQDAKNKEGDGDRWAVFVWWDRSKKTSRNKTSPAHSKHPKRFRTLLLKHDIKTQFFVTETKHVSTCHILHKNMTCWHVFGLSKKITNFLLYFNNDVRHRFGIHTILIINNTSIVVNMPRKQSPVLPGSVRSLRSGSSASNRWQWWR